MDKKPHTENTATETNLPAGLVGAETCLRLVFTDENTRPCLRFFRELQRKRLVPMVKVGRRTFFDPGAVRRALDRQFTVQTR